MLDESKAFVSKFEGTDFCYQKMQATNTLIQRTLYLSLKLEGEKPASMKRDTKCTSAIRLLLTRNVASSIRNENTSHNLMQTFLDDGSVSDPISVLTEIFDQIKCCREMQIIDKQMMVILLLRLLESSEAIIYGIINYRLRLPRERLDSQ